MTRVAFSGDGQWLSSNAGDVVCVWPFDGKGPAGRTPVNLVGHEGRVADAAWVPRDAAPTLVSGSTDGTVRVWTVPAGTARAVFELGEPVECVSASADGRSVFAGGRRGQLAGWLLAGPQ